VYPALTMWAGFEKSTGVYINTVNPEPAAKELRKMLTIHI
jgi:galactose-1-phosphate uridylyltransferase